MDNLFDILSHAQNGQAIDNLARQFALSQQQAMAATQALLPALSIGLKRQVDQARAEHVLPPNFFGLSGLPQIDAFQDAAVAFSRQAAQQGQQIMSALFGSEEVTTALARQAALQSGVAAPVLVAMLPMLASIVVSGLAQAAAPKARTNPLDDILASMMSAFQPSAPPAPAADGGLLAAMWAPFLAPPPPPPEPPSPADMFGQLLEAGIEGQNRQAEAMQSVLDAWFGKKS